MEKEKFKQNAKKTIDDIFNKIEELEQKRNHVSDRVKAKYDEQIAALKAKYADMEKDYQELESTSGQAWNDAKQKFSESADYFKAGLTTIAQIFNDNDKRADKA